VARSIEQRKSGALSVLDKGLVAAGVIGGVLVVLWVVHAVLGLALFAFKVAVLVVVVALVVRLVHLFTRPRR
jgi:Flp pilus assembly protein TadB